MASLTPEVPDFLDQAAELIRGADSLIITAGAGMGVDSGLPDFRGNEGFWRAYPALARTGMRFDEIANPEHFVTAPKLAWGFYGHRLQLYRTTQPHPGFAILKTWAEAKPLGAFVFTSNVDGQFQKAGFRDDQILECHGSIHHLQCAQPCYTEIWDAGYISPIVDEARCLLTSPLPRCPNCGEIARPNILMFGDFGWLPERTDKQQLRFRHWRAQTRRPVVIELGAGTAIPSVRRFGEMQQCPMIRINPREFDVHHQSAQGIPMGALDGLRALDSRLQNPESNPNFEP